MPSNMLRQMTIAVLILTGLAAVASADVKLAGVFGDHMVLQRGVALPVWGWADPGEAVTVTLGGQTKTATAAAVRKMVGPLRRPPGRRPAPTPGEGQEQHGRLQRRAGGRSVALLGPVEHGNVGRGRSQQGRRDRRGQSSADPHVLHRPRSGQGAAGPAQRPLGRLQPADRGRLLRRGLLLRPRASASN